MNGRTASSVGQNAVTPPSTADWKVERASGDAATRDANDLHPPFAISAVMFGGAGGAAGAFAVAAAGDALLLVVVVAAAAERGRRTRSAAAAATARWERRIVRRVGGVRVGLWE